MLRGASAGSLPVARSVSRTLHCAQLQPRFLLDPSSALCQLRHNRAFTSSSGYKGYIELDDQDDQPKKAKPQSHKSVQRAESSPQDLTSVWQPKPFWRPSNDDSAGSNKGETLQEAIGHEREIVWSLTDRQRTPRSRSKTAKQTATGSVTGAEDRGEATKESSARGQPKAKTSSLQGIRASMIAEDGKKLTVSEMEPMVRLLMSALKRVNESNTEVQSNLQNAVAVFCTPGQRHLLDPSAGLIQKLVVPGSRQGLETDVIYGIVDRIAVPDDQVPVVLEEPSKSDNEETAGLPPVAGAEGIAIALNLHLRASDGVSQGGNPDEAKSTAAHFQRGHISWTFGRQLSTIKASKISSGHHLTESPPDVSDRFKQVPAPILTNTVTLRLAHTVMETGTDFVLHHQRWRGTEILSDLPISHAEFDEVSPELLSLETSRFLPWKELVAVTQPRKIVSSFGNVIQSFRGPSDDSQIDGPIIAASSEIEAWFASGAKPGGEVWAAVLHSSAPWPLQRASSSRELFSIFAGAHIRLYRVHGGGGGWEGRGGPLTLDVDGEEANSSQGPESSDDLMAMERYLSGADSPVKPGDTVQFFYVAPEIGYSLPSTYDKRLYYGHFPCKQKYLLGTLPLSQFRSIPIGKLAYPLMPNGFCILSEHVSYTIEALGTGKDYGARQLGRLYSTALPPGTNCNVTMWELSPFRSRSQSMTQDLVREMETDRGLVRSIKGDSPLVRREFRNPANTNSPRRMFRL